MSNNYLSVLYKHIIQVENKNVGLKVGGGGEAQTYHCPTIKKVGGHMSLPTHTSRFLRQCSLLTNDSDDTHTYQRIELIKYLPCSVQRKEAGKIVSFASFTLGKSHGWGKEGGDFWVKHCHHHVGVFEVVYLSSSSL